MKKIIAYIIAGAALIFAASCSREPIGQTVVGDAIALQVYCSELTKADTTPGLGNENKVVSLDYFFFADTVSSSAVFHYRDAAPTATAGKYQGIFTPGQSYGGNVFPTREVLYGTNDHTTVFIVANLPEAKVPAALPAWEALKGIAVEQSFMANGAALPTDSDDMEFVMTAQVEVRGNITGVFTQVQLERLAAKMDFTIKVAKEVVFKDLPLDDDGNTYTETWTPMLNNPNTRAYLQQAVTNTVLGVADGAHYPETWTPVDYNPIVLDSWTADNEMTVGPFYTFPASWESNQALAPYGKIIVPWKVVRTNSNGQVFYSAQREVYYKVMLPGNEILVNNYYQFTVDITVVGTEGDPEVIIPCTYRVVDWATGGAGKVNGQISDIKYLTVDRSLEVKDQVTPTLKVNEFSVNSTQIQYAASGGVDIDWNNSRIYYLNYTNGESSTPGETNILNNNSLNNNNGKAVYNATTNRWEAITSAQTVKDWFTWSGGTEDEPNTYLILTHALNNDITNTYFDSAPYYFKIRLWLTADHSVYKDVVFVQYPAIYVRNIPSTTYTYVNATPWSTEGSTAYDDTGRRDSASDYLGAVGGNSYNNNHNQYSVTVSVLGSGNTITYGGNTYQMVIGDPRGEALPLKTNFDLGGTNGNNYLYRPAAENRQNYVAPKFIVASSYGATSAMTYEGAQKRCAAYQENGYPAGRWRLPTAAEIQFMITLSSFTPRRIPELFSPDRTSYYWAGGHYGIGGTKTNNKYEIRDFSSSDFTWWSSGYYTGNIGVWTRCVYDEWYWGDDKLDDATAWRGFHTVFIHEQ